jgi:WXG100 family type VII secretion target
VSVRYTVDLEQLAAHVDQARWFSGEVEETLARLDQVVAALHLSWQGAAAEAHRLAHREWVGGARELDDALARLRDAAARAHDDYLAAAETNRALWSALS